MFNLFMSSELNNKYFQPLGMIIDEVLSERSPITNNQNNESQELSLSIVNACSEE